MTEEERKLALHCLKASSDYHSEVCEECINYPNCDHTIQDDVTETIIKALEQEPCDDCVRRQEVLKAIDVKAWEFCDYLIRNGRNDEQKPVSHFADNLREYVGEELPPVTPQSETVTEFADRCQECGAKYGKLLKKDSCEDAIRRQEVLDAIQKLNIPEDMCVFEIISHIEVAIATLPPVAPQPKMGQWKIDAHRIRVLGNGTETHDYSVHCDRCHYGWDYTTDKEGSLVSNFCPNCGTKMEGDKNG